MVSLALFYIESTILYSSIQLTISIRSLFYPVMVFMVMANTRDCELLINERQGTSDPGASQVCNTSHLEV